MIEKETRMYPAPQRLSRREFAKTTTLLAGAAAVAAPLVSSAAGAAPRRIRTGVIGCGSVSNAYLPVLTNSPFVEVVSVCDIRPERATRQGERFAHR